MCNRKAQYRDVVRWQRTRAEQRRRYYQKTAGYPPRQWTAEEDALVLSHQQTDTKLSQQIRRSVASIQKRRWFLNQQL